MGVGVSGWKLARTVSQAGQLGVVSGTGLAVVLARRLQQGDADGHVRRALARMPLHALAQRVMDRYYVPGGKSPDEPFRLTTMPQMQLSDSLAELTVAANFVEVFLAKEDHDGVVGVNYLEKIQSTTLHSLLGAMLAGVDYVLMGAGIPRFIPGALDHLAAGQPAELKFDVEGALPGEQFACRLDPAAICGSELPALGRPKFLAIVSSATLAMTLARKSNGRVDGFIVEGAVAGGHNAPPRGPAQLSERGEPMYQERDVADLEKIRQIGLPYWLAGGYAEPEKLTEALALGANGIQVGTAFAFCDESDITAALKSQVIRQSSANRSDVFTDPLASPTGFPFKVLRLEGTVSQPDVYDARMRLCDLGYLRRPYRKADGTVGYRCPAEPVEQYVNKGGSAEDAVGRKCICNALFATIGLGQIDTEQNAEQALVTAGNDVVNVRRFLTAGRDSYTADDVLDYLLAGPVTATKADQRDSSDL
jgi:nitronate monooxygenase